jgi:hypothetical protein
MISRVPLLLALLVVAAAASLSSCNIVTPISYVVMGPPTVGPEFDLPDVPTVVFLDDRQNVVNPISLRKVIADRCAQELMVKKKLTNMISAQDAMAIAARSDRASNMMSIEQIGEAVGAQQVIYIEMVQFTETPDGAVVSPTAGCRVKVIDIQEKVRLYPPPGTADSSRFVAANLQPMDPNVLRTQSGRLGVFNALATETGMRVSLLFFEHDPKLYRQTLAPKAAN